MTPNDFQRALLAEFCIKQAGPGAAMEQMKAIALCMRNRVRQGWGSDWLQVIEQAAEYRAHEDPALATIDLNDRSQRVFLKDVDEIFFSRADWSDPSTHDNMPSLDQTLGRACYWLFLDQPSVRSWFQQNIISDPAHKQSSQMGIMLFFE